MNSTPNMPLNYYEIDFSISVLDDNSGHKITVSLKGNEEGPLSESILFENSDNKQLQISFLATVMGESRGTPSLKTGIRLLRKSFDTMSDANTEWQGFT